MSSYMVNCPFHNDSTASMKIYGDGFGYCFACCMQVPVSELKLPGAIVPIEKYFTPVTEELEYISSLPKKRIRGLDLHEDEQGYYIVWPNSKYYKKRLYEGKTRYRAPAGHKPPLFVCPGEGKHLLVVEGELNALSLDSVMWNEGFKIVSPGPAGHFLKYLEYYRKFDKITLFMDHDAAGIVHGMQIKDILLKHRKNVKLVTLKTDFNEKLQSSEDELTKYFWEVM